MGTLKVKLKPSSVKGKVGTRSAICKAPGRHNLFSDYMRRQIAQLKSTNQFGTALNYEKTWKSFSAFLKNADLPFSAFTEQLIADYYAFLIQRGLVRNSVSFYMRVLRAVYNKAVRQKMVKQGYPFHNVYTGIDRTRKRAVDETVITQLHKLDLPHGSQLALTRDLFIFSYCTRGMAFVDIAYLKRTDILDGTICYARRKTGQLLKIRIEPCIKRIIDRYASNQTPYVFPLLTDTDSRDSYMQYLAAINAYNRMLCKLSKRLPSKAKLTSYTARHSWATAARDHHVPISVISAGMGHASEQTTRIYLTMLENSAIDEANSEIIKGLRISSM